MDKGSTIPVAYDFTPNWSTGNNGHSWNTVYTTRFGNLEFAPHTTDPGTVHYPYLKVPKIFRNVYKPNEEWSPLSEGAPAAAGGGENPPRPKYFGPRQGSTLPALRGHLPC